MELEGEGWIKTQSSLYTEKHTDSQRVPSKSESTSRKTHWYKMDENEKVKMPAVTAGASNPGPQGLSQETTSNPECRAEHTIVNFR